ncbi:MAG: hypothetical protein JST80_06640 [Bdellovibrionales bacterium]|nr:hypothetical protein [Bdellovibrionales bacterium]
MSKKKIHPDIEVLEVVAKRLGTLLSEVVFVGGATTTLYITDPNSPESIATQDVDMIVEISGLLEFEVFEKKLAKLGFKKPINDDSAPMCRYILDGIKVDVMPKDSKILGFSNRWYPDAIVNAL